MLLTWTDILDAAWLWAPLAWALLVGSVVLALWALFWDRPGWLGRPRECCPRCRYDMTGTPGDDTPDHPLTCPECGRVVKGRRALRKTRRRWGFVAAAAVMLVGWHLARSARDIRAVGWVGAVPTTALVLMVDPAVWYTSRYGDADSVPAPWSPLMVELDHDLDTCSGWQLDIWLARLRAAFPDRLACSRRATVTGPWGMYDVGDLAPSITYTYGLDVCDGDPFYFAQPRYHGELLSRDTACELADLLIWIDDEDSRADFGGSEGAIVSFRDRLIVIGPDELRDRIADGLALLRRPVVFPASISDSSRLHGRYVLRFPLDTLGVAAHGKHYAPFDDTEEQARQSKIRDIMGLLMERFDPDGWMDLGGDHHTYVSWGNQLWIASDLDVRQQIIDEMTRIRDEGVPDD
ncbi:MAG: hypothetical protein H6810_01270 [Phycisphaeraceae bacterium]|nr:MAG: hypothetical protein H6810_01270 [Phycisphaeraceae bacterium]